MLDPEVVRPELVEEAYAFDPLEETEAEDPEGDVFIVGLLDNIPEALLVDIPLEEDDDVREAIVGVDDEIPAVGVRLALVLEADRTDDVEGFETAVLVNIRVDVGEDMLEKYNIDMALTELVEMVEELVTLMNLAKLDELVTLIVLEDSDAAVVNAEVVVELTF